MKRSDFNYELPEELIAQDPIEDRTASRLMVLDKSDGSIEHRHFGDIKEYLREGDCLVLNDTKVIPARLLGARSETGGAVEILLLKRLSIDRWECIVRPARRLRTGACVTFGDGELDGVITDTLEGGGRIIDFKYNGVFEEILDRLGEMPLPPYITHKLPREQSGRYQTVYAKYEGSAAAPTAGLHFTKELLSELESQGVALTYVTLHVGLGTFRPVKTDDIRRHHMHTEMCEISESAAGTINETRARGGRIVCVGTTSVRTLESFTDADGIVRSGQKGTDIFIYPGYNFRSVDALITNFHMPESTLIMLVSAFAGTENVLNAYRVAVDEKYRFFSFGDAMFIH